MFQSNGEAIWRYARKDDNIFYVSIFILHFNFFMLLEQPFIESSSDPNVRLFQKYDTPLWSHWSPLDDD